MKKFCVFLVLFLICSPVFAVSGIVTWNWYENDPLVRYFRYQVDGENDDNWTLVDNSVYEVAVELDVSVPHTLYLQQSYDGIIWSVSSSVDSQAHVAAEEEPAAETEPVSEEPEETVEKAPAAEPVEEKAPVAEIPAYIPKKYLDFGIGYMNSIPNGARPKSLGGFISYSTNYYKTGAFDIGFKTNFSLYTTKAVFFESDKTQFFSSLDALAIAAATVAKSELYFGIGLGTELTISSAPSNMAGVTAEIGVRYHRNEKFTFGLAVSDRCYFIPKISNSMDVRIFFSKTL